ncbi:MAG: bacteriohopanetetrol glucosamine biosynthesis glycosyltransferase HpnI [Acidobacteria bacterium]|nr:bacteriohopanetetrol glucosamine biosynthesis glycosyltransferase HpnI [Acidobacteriota bacterium]
MMMYILAVPAAYQILAILASLRRLFFRERLTGYAPAVSFLKPVRGADPYFYEAIESHAQLNYAGEFEILFGVMSPNDTAIPYIQRLIAAYPNHRIRLVQIHTVRPNGKVGALIDLYREASHPVIVINDSDIKVMPDYLTKIVAPLENPQIGLVTCLYRAAGASFAGWFEGLGVDTDFAPSTLVAQFVGVDEFALGSTLAMRRQDLDRIGGLEPISSYIADDYQLGHRIHQLGLKCHLAEPTVDTHLGAETFRDAWQHQVRWARTIRACRGGGYMGLPATFATLWAVVAMLAGNVTAGLALLGVRMLLALISSVFVLKARTGLPMLLLVPLRDLFAVAVWIAGIAGHRVYWRDFAMSLDGEGRIVQSIHSGGTSSATIRQP